MKRGEVNLVGIIVAVLCVGLFVSILGSWVYMNQDTYDMTGNEMENFSATFNRNNNVTVILDSAYDTVEGVTVNPNWFDYLAGLFNKLLAPFKLIYNSIFIVFSLTSSSFGALGLLPVIGDFIRAVLISIVIVGIVMIRMYMNK